MVVNKRLHPSRVAEIARCRALCHSGEAKAIRIRAGVSLSDIAEELEVSINGVWCWENGQRSPRSEVAVRYVELLDELARCTRIPA